MKSGLKMLRLSDRFSISPAHLILGLVSVLCMPSHSFAATRTIQFAGVATTFGDRALPNLTQWVACTVMVANTGATAQFIESITFNAFNSAGGDLRAHTSDATTHTVTLEEVYRPTNQSTAPFCTQVSGGSGCVGTGNQFGAGGMYVATVQTRQFAQVGFAIVPCSGSVTVSDVTPNQPGSMVAAGAISFTSEQAITGGQFMGAMYMSGSHYTSTSPTAAASFPYNAFGTEALPATQSAMQMNIYCASACAQASGKSAKQCAAICGGGDAEGGVPLDTQMDPLAGGHGFRNFSGYLEEYSKQSNGLIEAHVSGFDAPVSPIESRQLNTFGYDVWPKATLWPGGGDAYPAGVGALAFNSEDKVAGEALGLSTERISSRPFHDNKGGLAGEQIRAAIRYANPHYAGGHVVEMIMGPYETICSGNRGYFDIGGQDFPHTDSVETDTTYKLANPTVAGRGPPERLYCSHAHSNDSPFGYVAQSSPFTIWGGNAF